MSLNTVVAQKKPSGTASLPSPNSSNNTIKIGVNFVISDPDDLPQLRAARMAVDEINAAGGVLGKTIEIITSYSQTRNYSQIHASLQTLISRGATTVLLTGGSGAVLKAAELTIQKGVLLMASSASSPHITNLTDKNLVWRTVPSDVFQGKLAARLIDSLKYRTVSVIYLNNAYGNELYRAFRKEFEKRGGKVLSGVKYSDTTTYKSYDFKNKLEMLYRDNPDVIYMISYIEDGREILLQSEKYGFVQGQRGVYQPLFLGCDGNYNPALLKGVRADIVEGMIGLAYTHPKSSPNYQRFVEAFQAYSSSSSLPEELASSQESVSEATNTFAAASYDAVYALAYAMAKAGSTQASDIAAALRQISGGTKNAPVVNVQEFTKGLEFIAQGKNINYEGASGSIDFDMNGDVLSGTYIVWKVVNGKFTESGTVSFP
jgi:ABC-type branched-subunit amino acid transport system substrate-binding protein